VALRAVLLRQLDALAFDTVDSSDRGAVFADDLHMLFDFHAMLLLERATPDEAFSCEGALMEERSSEPCRGTCYQKRIQKEVLSELQFDGATNRNLSFSQSQWFRACNNDKRRPIKTGDHWVF
jgi:hypothetical protein